MGGRRRSWTRPSASCALSAWPRRWKRQARRFPPCASSTGRTAAARAVVTFRASEIGLPAFGTNIPNTAFNRVLKERIAATPSVTRITAALSCLHLTDEKAVLHLSDGQLLSADLVAGADGSVPRCASGGRRGAGMVLSADGFGHEFRARAAAHDRLDRVPHGRWALHAGAAAGRSVEPRLGHEAARCRAHRALPLTELSLAVERRMQSMLGKVTVEAAPQSFRFPG